MFNRANQQCSFYSFIKVDSSRTAKFSLVSHRLLREMSQRARAHYRCWAPTHPLPATSTIQTLETPYLAFQPAQGKQVCGKPSAALVPSQVWYGDPLSQFSSTFLKPQPQTFQTQYIQEGRRNHLWAAARKQDPLQQCEEFFFSWQRLHRLSFKAI